MAITLFVHIVTRYRGSRRSPAKERRHTIRLLCDSFAGQKGSCKVQVEAWHTRPSMGMGGRLYLVSLLTLFSSTSVINQSQLHATSQLHPSSIIDITIYRKSRVPFNKHLVGQHISKVIEILENG